MKKLFSLIIVVISFSCQKNNEDATTILAEYTLGSSGNCTGASVSGRFVTDTVLTSLNTVTITIDVTVAGAYWITTNTINGITFSNIGTFTTTGPQTVVLTGTGTPVAIDTSNFTLMAKNGQGGSCTFPIVTMQGILPHYYISCFLNGIYRNFSDSAGATNSNVPGNSGMPGLEINGFDTVINVNSKIDFGVGNIGMVSPGSYTDTTSSRAYFDYTDSTGERWSVNTSGQPSLTIVLTTAGLKNVQGTFSGIIKNQQGFGPDSIIVTNGLYNVPVR